MVHALLAEVSLGAAVPVAEAHEAAGRHEPQPGGAQRALFFVIISVVGRCSRAVQERVSAC